jgi:pyruvate kinase
MSGEEADELKGLIAALDYLRSEAMAHVSRHVGELERTASQHRRSAENLLHYLAIRQHDLRELQSNLAGLGLSSLGRSEASVLATLNACATALRALNGDDPRSSAPTNAPIELLDGQELLRSNTKALLGRLPPGRKQRIMVTAPSTAATDRDLVRGLVEAGMNIMRINSAHDDPTDWEAMVAQVRNASAARESPCLVEFDLAGPKLRTGELASDGQIIHWRPKRNHRGAAIKPVRVLVVPNTDGILARQTPEGVAAVLPSGPWRFLGPHPLPGARKGGGAGGRRDVRCAGTDPGILVSGVRRCAPRREALD